MARKPTTSTPSKPHKSVAEKKQPKSKAKAAPAAKEKRKAAVAEPVAVAAKPARSVKSKKTPVEPAPVAAVETKPAVKPAPVSKPAVVKPAVKTIVAKSVDADDQSDDDTPFNAPLSDAQLRKVKTGLSKKDLMHYRQLLMDKRAELLVDVEALQGDARNDSGGNLSSMPLHMADLGTDNYEQEFTLGLVETEKKLLREIDEALMRIKSGTYGVCMERGIPIARPRLDAKPWAKYCIEVVRERERLGLM